jgi:hypothetical protein
MYLDILARGQKDKLFIIKDTAGCWWLMSAILATWEAEMWRIEVRRQPGQIVLETPSPNLQNNQSKVDWRCGSMGRACLQA